MSLHRLRLERLAAPGARVPTGQRAVAIGAGVLSVLVLPKVASSPWSVQEAGMVVLGMAGMPVLVRLAAGHSGDRSRVWAARFAVAFVVVGFVAALRSYEPALSLTGPLYGGSGWVFMVGVTGAWALGTRLDDRGRDLLEVALVAGALANATVAVLQDLVDLGRIGIPAAGPGEPIGLQQNAVFLGGLLVAALWLLGGRFARGPRTWWTSVGLVALGLGVCAERAAIALALGIAAFEVGTALRARRRAEVSPSPGARPAGAFAALVVVGIGLGTALGQWRGRGVVGQALHSSAEGTFGDRLHAWLWGVHGFLSHPLVGWGPGQFRTATSALEPAWFIRTRYASVFADAHNLFLEYAVTTGVLGLCALLGWLWLSGRGRHGRLLGFAVLILVVELIEPLNAVITPLAALALGASAVRGAAPAPPDAPSRATSGRVLRWSMILCVTIGAVGATDLVAGDVLLTRADAMRLVGDPGDRGDARTADTLLHVYPEPAHQLALIALLGQDTPPAGGGAVRGAPPAAVYWDAVAARRDPTNTALWNALAVLQLKAGDLPAAQGSIRQALRFFPWDATALLEEGNLALAQGDTSRAGEAFAKLVQVDPGAQLRVLMGGRCQPLDLGTVRGC